MAASKRLIDVRRGLRPPASAARDRSIAADHLTSARCEWVGILDEDPDLCATLDPKIATRARRLLRAPVVILDRDDPRPPEYDPATTFGLLVLSGLMGRRVGIGRAHAIELLGPGDILRPWDHDHELDSVPAEIEWRVFRPIRIAVLGGEITRVIGQRPELLIAFSGRLLHRARASAYLAAVSHLTSVDDKVLVTLWHLASRWGRVSPQGVEITLSLTHEVIGEIIGARRPTVTLALSRMVRRKALRRGPRGTFILLDPPRDLWSGRFAAAGLGGGLAADG
jgi:CRP/FNR family transcriptional regulator, cyclic AMP receptor protein